jgi:hypothetical protein
MHCASIYENRAMIPVQTVLRRWGVGRRENNEGDESNYGIL